MTATPAVVLPEVAKVAERPMTIAYEQNMPMKEVRNSGRRPKRSTLRPALTATMRFQAPSPALMEVIFSALVIPTERRIGAR